MKHSQTYLTILLWFCAVCCSTQLSHATDYAHTSVYLTKTTSTLNATSVLHLPTDYATSLFDASQKPTMHKLYILSTISAAAGHSVDGVTLSAGDWLFSFRADADNNRYVMDMTPFDPTLTALPPVDVNELKTSLSPSGSNIKVYITGQLENKVRAELPEDITLLAAPSYVRNYEQKIKDAIISKIHTNIIASEVTFKDLTFNAVTEGFFYFTGDETAALDLYLDNLQFGVQDKKIDFLGMMLIANNNLNFNLASLSVPAADQNDPDKVAAAVLTLLEENLSSVRELIGEVPTLQLIAQLFADLIQGTAAPFAFSSNTEYTNNPFKVNIHSKGSNTITGGAKVEFKNIVDEMTYMTSHPSLKKQLEELSTIFQQVVQFTCAPLSVRPSSHIVKKGESDDYKYTVTRFTFDDEFPVNGTTTHVNGLLDLPVVGNDIDAPSIDLGTPYGQVVFNSGRYKFHTPVSNKVKNMFFVASMSICYRELAITMPYVGRITYPGIGTSVGTGPAGTLEDNYTNVTINGGTFETYSSALWAVSTRGVNAVDGVGNGWYENYTDWRLPYNTKVLGGSFTNCEIRRCDAAAEMGSVPIYVYEHGTKRDTTYLCERTPYTGASLNNGTYSVNSYGILQTSSATKAFSVNGGGTWNYKIQYLTPDADKKVYIYDPTVDCQKLAKGYVHNYSTAMVPLGEHHINTNMMTMGGDIEVQARYQEQYRQTNAYLLYIQLGYYTRKYAGISFMNGVRRTIEQEMQVDVEQHKNYSDDNDKTGVIYSNVTNSAPYRIEYGSYMMLPIMSNQWFMISPPFDVAKVYVLETTKTRGQAGWDDDQWEEYYEAQGVADGDMAQVLVTSVLPDVFSQKGSGVLKPLPEILRNQTNKNTRLRELTHYNGSNILSAHYYLNVFKSDVENEHKWLKQENDEFYGNNWEPAPATIDPKFISGLDPTCEDILDCDEIELPYTDQSGTKLTNPKNIMTAGNIYSMFFPGGTSRYYDYKYLVLEGYGPQNISGTNSHSGYYSSLPESPYYAGNGYLALQGNSTCANAVITGITPEHPLFYQDPRQGAYSDQYEPFYTFAENTAAEQEILPSRVYMVTDNDKVIKASMPMLHNNTKTTTAIDELDQTEPLPLIANTNISLEAWSDNGIALKAYETQQVTIYSVDGHLIWQGILQPMQQQHISAPAGLYLIQGEETTVKLIVN